MERFDAISKRASVRKFRREDVPKEILEKIIDAGRRAPTARAVEPWEFVAVTDAEVLAELGALADHGPFIKDAACCVVVFCEDTKYYLEDGCAATENILLAVAAAGLGACWVAGDKKAYAPQVSELLGVPGNMRLISLLAVGWPETEIEQKKKRSLDDVIHWEKF
ncbi:MAG: nitroreductase family protein [Candidatus Tantalella remota]|nr:nitroreductase family protein [Candidatus Tantalella remota]